VDKIKNYLDIMDDTLSRLKGIEYSLYYEIVKNGVNKTLAVDKVSRQYNKECRTIWKYHYCKIKKDLEKIRKVH
jgi:hypothetical protein